ncbi:hypothetical protein BDV93DRAFT_559074 [Ceratobasidium sp. AG-I]|nr:hypothetical protein BDV93DRAFT_559074 [Ceratobasidium sp. AG-I]
MSPCVDWRRDRGPSKNCVTSVFSGTGTDVKVEMVQYYWGCRQWADDAWWLQNAKGKGYLTLVSPWFFIHLAGGDPAINNRYFRGDNFEYQVATWNDYGESHYIGPMTGLAPAGATYVTPKNDHQAWADYTWYYATWWKSDAAPTIATDRVYMWARPHPKSASICSTDGVGAVNNAAWADDLLCISVFLKSTAQVYRFSGSNNSGTKTLNAGVNEFTVPLAAGRVGCSVTRSGVNLINFKPTDLTYSTAPTVCNVNERMDWTATRLRIGNIRERQDTNGGNNEEEENMSCVFAHVIVGNAYNYTIEQWTSNIELVSSKAIDVFSLNVRSDSWQPERVKQAYDAAQEAASDFKLSISLDMNELACASAADEQRLIDNFHHAGQKSSQRFYLPFENIFVNVCGGVVYIWTGKSHGWWQWLLSSAAIPIYFIPNFHVGDPTALNTTWNFIDGYNLWNAWPQTGKDDTQWPDDAWDMQHAPGKSYMTLVSPWFFIRRSSGANRYHRGDNFMYRSRWEQLIENRDSLNLVEIATWNHFGESAAAGWEYTGRYQLCFM